MQRLLIDQANITDTHIDEVASPDLAPGQARMRIDRFALTANNVTYALTGHQIGYWQFFPTGVDGQGMLPVWGYADVVESAAKGLDAGTRLYGFWPLAEELVIEPQEKGERVIVDAVAHRAKLPPLYNRYTRVTAKPAPVEGMQALLQPLLGTAFLLCDWLQDNAFFNADQVIVGSASSKTGLGLCLFLAELDPRPVRVIGLTSARNKAFVAATGGCDEVLSYDEIDRIQPTASVYVDMAGDADVKTRLHAHLASHLQQSCAVGISHWDQFRSKLDLAGPKPEFFFAPAQIEKRRADWGPGVIEQKVGDGVRRLASQASDWLEIRAHSGVTAAQEVYTATVNGDVPPREGHVITL